ncbi:hypothetical protein PPYR_13675 [Photinus pyralis]|uniref:LRRCT domain-containing protein n=1 Tax=Photinus pyralis TaxID=7054 RepID=A0A5N4A9Q7_PHOPY|nr:leucine-rich repeat-containing protein let-4-like [Photinus pyralis]KAB0794055.1 hypothetical protein PPYR_13675 [Photinus pyralis]
MLQLVIAFTILYIIPSYSSRVCEETSFPNIPVWVKEESGERFQTVQGCITSTQLHYNILKKIRVSRQRFTSLKRGAVANISANFSLQFIHNPNLTTVMGEAFLNIPCVLEIDLSDNMINWIESNVFDNMLYLEAIDLSKNQLEVLMHHTFHHLPNLTIIDLSDNKFEHFNQYWFYNASKLEIIFASNNRISSLPRASFITLPSLQGIDLENNQIFYIHKLAFQGLETLRELYLGKNKLTNLQVDFSPTPNLRFLGVNENQITYISDQTLTQLQSALRMLWIHFNPWQCSCIEKVLNWGATYNISVSFKCSNSDLFCVVPKTFQDECTDLRREDFYSDCFSQFQGFCNKIIN